jgi:hypothetical protein
MLICLMALIVLGVSSAAAVSTTLVINEIEYDQASTDAAEYVEIMNVSGAPIDLDLYDLYFVNGSTGLSYDIIDLPAFSLAAGDFYVVCANAATVANCDLDDDPDTNFIQNGAPDAVALRLSGAVVDTVSYEGDTAGYTEGSGAGLEDNPDAGTLSISRCPDGADSDQNNVDLIQTDSTPGAANDCGVSAAELVINEIDYDQPSTDGAEYLEVRNNSASAVDLDLYDLVFVNGSDGSTYDTIDLPAFSLAAGDYYVVCANAATVADCDLDDGPDTNFIQNGAPDAIALRFQGAVIDAVSYEGDTAGYTEGPVWG